MALFEFALWPVEKVPPWGPPEALYLSWYALTQGDFWMPVGEQVLFEYTEQIQAHWEFDAKYSDYQIAAFVRDMLGSFAAGIAPLPPRIERLVLDREKLAELRAGSNAFHREQQTEESFELDLLAWRWWGERLPWTSYLVACPLIEFFRVGDEVRIRWDHRQHLVDGHRVWTADEGMYALSVEAFTAECQQFSTRLLDEMERRISAIETGALKPPVPVDVQSLREEHKFWQAEFAGYFREHRPEVSWADTERALEIIAKNCGLEF